MTRAKKGTLRLVGGSNYILIPKEDVEALNWVPEETYVEASRIENGFIIQEKKIEEKKPLIVDLKKFMNLTPKDVDIKDVIWTILYIATLHTKSDEILFKYGEKTRDELSPHITELSHNLNFIYTEDDTKNQGRCELGKEITALEGYFDRAKRVIITVLQKLKESFEEIKKDGFVKGYESYNVKKAGIIRQSEKHLDRIKLMCNRNARYPFYAHLFKNPENYYYTQKIIDCFEQVSDIAVSIMDEHVMKLAVKIDDLDHEIEKLETTSAYDALMEFKDKLKNNIMDYGINTCEIGGEIFQKIQINGITDKQLLFYIKNIYLLRKLNYAIDEELEKLTKESKDLISTQTGKEDITSAQKALLDIVSLIPFMISVLVKTRELTGQIISVGEYIMDGYEINLTT